MESKVGVPSGYEPNFILLGADLGIKIHSKQNHDKFFGKIRTAKGLDVVLEQS